MIWGENVENWKSISDEDTNYETWVCKDGRKEWYLNGTTTLHRVGGPYRILPRGMKHLNGLKIQRAL